MRREAKERRPTEMGERGEKGKGRLVRMTTNERRPTGVIRSPLPVTLLLPLSLLSPSLPRLIRQVQRRLPILQYPTSPSLPPPVYSDFRGGGGRRRERKGEGEG